MAIDPLGEGQQGRGLPSGAGISLILALAIVAAGCGPAQGVTTPSGERSAGRTKAITIPVLNAVPGFHLGFGGTSPTGGWLGLSEVHSNGLLTTEATTRQRVGLLAEKVPSLDDGSVSVLPDGRMRIVWALRKGVTWQDGAPFTAQDLVFTTRLLQDPGVPWPAGLAIPRRIGSVETPDDHTFVAYLGTPYYDAISHGLGGFWPLPQHILGSLYDKYLASNNPDEVLSNPYWTSEYVHLGPFRLTSFDPTGTISFQAYDGYFRGRPRLDVIRIQVFLNSSALFASVLAGHIDLFLESTVEGDEALQLVARWREGGDGRVYLRANLTRYLMPQYRPASLDEPALMDPRVRIAFSHALNREELGEVFSGSPAAAAYTVMVPSEPLYDAVKDIFRAYAYDPERAKAILRDLGWTPGSDGKVRHISDGRLFHTSLTGTPGGDREIAAVAGLWRAIGVEVDELVVPPSLTSNREYRASYPGWQLTSGSYSTLKGPPASAASRWVGNRHGYDDPRFDALYERVENTLSERERFQAMTEVAQYVAALVPLVPVAYNVHYLGVRKGVKALEDTEGGDYSHSLGSYSRNAHLWDVE